MRHVHTDDLSVADTSNTPDSTESVEPLPIQDVTEPEFEIITVPEALQTEPYFETSQVPKVTESDIEMFNYMAEHAAASYCNTNQHNYGKGIFCFDQEDRVCPILRTHSTSIIGLFDSGFQDMRAYTAVDHTSKEIVLSISGSNGPGMWSAVSNFTIVDWPLVPQAMAHQQFIQVWNYMDPEAVALSMNRAKRMYPDYSMKATGHSLGGAVAMLAAAQLRLEHDLPIDVYSFGAPKLGNEHLSRFIEEQEEGKNFRITHLNDPISRLPRGCTGYTHISTEYWLMGQSATEDTYPVEDVQVCEGMTNMECNAGTVGGNMGVHFTYFGDIGGCRPPSQIDQLPPPSSQ